MNLLRFDQTYLESLQTVATPADGIHSMPVCRPCSVMGYFRLHQHLRRLRYWVYYKPGSYNRLPPPVSYSLPDRGAVHPSLLRWYRIG